METLTSLIKFMLKNSPLGQTTVYIEKYSPDLLYPIPRTLARQTTGIKDPLPFKGVDIWNAYEISWLKPNGVPEIAFAVFIFSSSSPLIIESKSFKLYLNSFNQSVFNSFEDVQKVLEKDLSLATQSEVFVDLFPPHQLKEKGLGQFSGICLDHVDAEIDTYQVAPHFLQTSQEQVDETVYSDLLKSNCLATGQPDWGSVHIRYVGPKILHQGLLKYIVSFRQHSGFAEHCTEQIFHDIWISCRPEKLSVYTRYTRRGGLDINPFRSNFEENPYNTRHLRQ